MDIREGYKKTEIGVIPEDWDIVPIDKVVKVSTGSKNTQDKLSDGKYPFFVRSQTIERINSFSYDCEAVLTAGDGVGTGKIFHYVNEKFELHQRVYVMNEFSEKLNGYFFYLYFSNNFYGRIMQMTAKSSVDSVRREMIADMQIPLPPLPEQKAIAQVLSDTDHLIQSLEKLIAKKRLIKQGAMQKLLSPKEGWEVKKLGDFLNYEQPTNYLVTDTEYNDSYNIPVLTAGKTFILGFTNETFGVFKELPAIIFDDFTTAIKFVDFPFKAKSSAMKILKPKNEEVNLRFIYEIMQRIDFPLGDHKRHWISEFQHLEIKVPSSEEQSRIATILSDMDAEIETLDKKLAKYKQLKLGLMQSLLTGKIRLI